MFKFYRSLSSAVLKPLIEPKVFKKSAERNRIFENSPAEKRRKRIWFHASSVGELEMLIPIIEKRQDELVLTVFSESAEGALQKLAERLKAQRQSKAEEGRQGKGEGARQDEGAGGEMIFVGFCPWEGEWKRALEVYRPDLFVSARYEAWPELWASLGELKIPLTVVGSQLRTSLRVAKNVLGLMMAELPRLQFLSIDEAEVGGLRKEFPGAYVSAAGDPRWDRVAERAKLGNPRARQLVEKFEKCERDWGVLGSAWIEDLELLGERVFELPGTIWVVPHQVDSGHIREFEGWLSDRKIPFTKTSSVITGQSSVITETSLGRKNEVGHPSLGRASPNSISSNSLLPKGILSKCIVVDEMGFLSELYAAADWAYVGGGFGKGVHNTIEPAIHGIPVFCGPAKNHRFPEIQYLKELGQLTVLKDSEDVVELRNAVTRGRYRLAKSLWKESASRKLGASARIAKILDESLAGAC